MGDTENANMMHKPMACFSSPHHTHKIGNTVQYFAPDKSAVKQYVSRHSVESNLLANKKLEFEQL